MTDQDKPVRRVRAGQPPADLEHWEIDLNELPDDPPLSDAIAALAVLVIILIVGACAALVVGVI
jgi:hypothetical protein